MSKKLRRRNIILRILEFALLSGLVYLQYFADKGHRPDESAEHFVKGLIILLSAHLIIMLLKSMVISIYRKRRRMQKDETDNFMLGIHQIASMLVFFVMLFSFSVAFQIDLKGLFTSLSIIAAALAILSKDYISNMLNGMILMFSNHISLNDHVKIGIHKGVIVDITLLNVHLMNDEDDLILIPNNMALSVEVVNFTKRIVNKVNFGFEMKLELLESVAELEEVLTMSVAGFNDHIVANSHNLRTVEIKGELALLNFQYVMREPNKEMEKEIRKTVARAIIAYTKRGQVGAFRPTQLGNIVSSVRHE